MSGQDRRSGGRPPEHGAGRVSADELWEFLAKHQGESFRTVKGLAFTYRIRGGEMIVDRKEKTITKSSVELAWRRVAELDGVVTGPKKLGVFGASYLYPVFLALGFMQSQRQ